jgi:hypothetical protein
MDFALDCPHLSLAPSWASEDDARRIVLVQAVDALRMIQGGEFAQASKSAVLWAFDHECQRQMAKVRDFAVTTGMANPYSTRFTDDDVVDLLKCAIRQGDVVGVGKAGAGAGETDATLAQRRLVRELEARTRGKLSEGSRQFKLVAGADLAGMPDRNSYEVVRHDEAKRVLEGLAKESAGPAAILNKACAQLSPDWRPPFSPKGVVLLRRINAPRAAVASQDPALTPSQIWGKAKKEKDDIIDWTIWIELDPADPKASDDVVILLDEFHQEVVRKPLASCPREGTGVLVKFEKLNKHDRFTLIRDYGPNEGGGQDTLFIGSSPAEMDERGRQAS